jgi:hypothetical protein
VPKAFYAAVLRGCSFGWVSQLLETTLRSDGTRNCRITVAGAVAGGADNQRSGWGFVITDTGQPSLIHREEAPSTCNRRCGGPSGPPAIVGRPRPRFGRVVRIKPLRPSHCAGHGCEETLE